jgi:hypothetical protein
MEDWYEAPVAIPDGEREADPGAGAGAEQIDEPDTEHDDLTIEEEPWPGLLEEKMNLLRDALQGDDTTEAPERLERLLETMQDHELRSEEVGLTTLADPVFSLLAQHRAYRIGRTRMFCPVDGCTKPIAFVSRPMGHLRRDHGVSEEYTQDLVPFFIGTVLPGTLNINRQRTNGVEVRGE